MASRTLTGMVAATARQASPDTSFSGVQMIAVGAGTQIKTYLYWARPFPLGATIQSATLRLKVKSAIDSPGRSVTARMITEPVPFNQITWNNLPTATGTVATASASGVPTEVTLNVAPMMQSVSTGTTWHGIELTSTTAIDFEGTGTAGQPSLEITWAGEMSAPTNLRPGGGGVIGSNKPTLTWDAADQTAFEIQVDDAVNFGSPTFVLSTTTGETGSFDLSSAPSFTGFPTGVKNWWRVRVRNSAGSWSDWSTPAEVTFKPLPTVTITSPSGSTFGNPNPTVAWSVTGGTQAEYRVTMMTISDTETPYGWDSGRRSGSATSISVPFPAVEGRDYEFTVTVWDTETGRIASPGSPVYAEARKTSKMTANAALTGTTITDITSTGEGAPVVNVNFTYNGTGTPSAFVLIKDGVSVGTFTPSAVGGVYTITDLEAQPNSRVQYSVRPVVGGVLGAAATSQAFTPRTWGIWLLAEGMDPLLIIDDQEVSDQTESAETVHRVFGGTGYTVIRQAVRGLAGSVSGLIAGGVKDFEDIPVEEWHRRAVAMRENPNNNFRLVFGARNIPVSIANFAPPLEKAWEEIVYRVSFDFYEKRG